VTLNRGCHLINRLIGRTAPPRRHRVLVGFAVSAKTAELLLVVPDPAGQRLDGGAKVPHFGQYAGQAPRVTDGLTVFFDHGPEALVPVECGPADPSTGGNGGKGHGLSLSDKVGAGPLDSGQGLWAAHDVGASAKRVSRRATRRR